MDNNYAVHVSHCCKWHGCKYGEPNCPIVLSKTKQAYLCEWCYEELNNEYCYRQKLKDIEVMKSFIKGRDDYGSL